MITYMKIGWTSWVAYNGRQAIWESWSEEQLLKDLKAKGYRRDQLVKQRFTICFMRG